jgi:hypothetical protein
MRTWQESWRGKWIAGLGPAECRNNGLLYVGQVAKQFESNASLGRWIKKDYPDVWECKLANNNPRGDLYEPRLKAIKFPFSHDSYVAPKGHTRSEEFYSKSPGSTSTRNDGKIPKWWRDVEYITRQCKRPPCLVLDPCFLFNQEHVACQLSPGRAALRITPQQLLESLHQ